jgi:hypothetical protein
MTEGPGPIDVEVKTRRDPHPVKLTKRPMGGPRSAAKMTGTHTPEAAAVETDPARIKANEVLQQRIDDLTAKTGIDTVDQTVKGWKKIKMLREMNKHKDAIGELQNLQFALQADGDLSPFLKNAALADLAPKIQGTEQHDDVMQALDMIKPQADEAATKFFTLLRTNGINESIIAKIAEDPHWALSEDKAVVKKLSKLPLQQYFFKAPPTDADINAMTETLTPEQRAALDDEETKEGKMGKRSLLLLILMAPLLAIGALAAGGTMLIGKAFGGGQQGY